MKRFYRTAAIAEFSAGFVVTLDGKTIKTPGNRPLCVGARRLAQAIADEWGAQGETIRPESQRLTRLANAGIDFIESRRAAVVDDIARYAGTDLLCYRSADDADLRRRQDVAWQPVLDWAASRYGARLVVVEGIMPCVQPEAVLAALRAAVDEYGSLALAALNMATAIAGSLVIGLALAEGRIDAAEAFDCAELDATYQIEKWGEDGEVRRRRESLRADLDSAETFLNLMQD